MSFAIEVPGGANPLSLHDLCRTLEAATTSLDYAQRQAAEQQLSAWETTPGYYSSLQVSVGRGRTRTRTRLPPIFCLTPCLSTCGC